MGFQSHKPVFISFLLYKNVFLDCVRLDFSHLCVVELKKKKKVFMLTLEQKFCLCFISFMQL